MTKHSPSNNSIASPITEDGWKLAEKSIELTTCAQFGQLLEQIEPGVRMVWFGLTQKEERRYGFDASTHLGGRALILQFKVSRTVLQRGVYANHRKFWCQHHQMVELKRRFGNTPNQCFYFFPNLGTFSELRGANGDILGNSFILDVAHLPATIPNCRRANGYHFAYLDAENVQVTVASEPFTVDVVQSNDLFRKSIKSLGDTARVVEKARALDGGSPSVSEMFFRNAALAVFV